MKGNFNALINDTRPVLVDFYAEWCGPCKVLAPVLQQVATEIKEKARIVKIDVDKNQELASRFQVQGVPTLIIFKNGEIKWRQSGALSKVQLLQVLNKFM